jgi:putative acetyltransferase
VESIVEEAITLGYHAMRLDTLDRLIEAMVLYESTGFRPREPYYDNPLPGVIYWEMELRTPEGVGCHDRTGGPWRDRCG